MELASNVPVLNEYECPLLTLSTTVVFVHSTAISTAISVMHQCSDTCSFVRTSCFENRERESVSTNKLVFQHDWSNNLYCLNVYCMGF